MGKKCGNDVLRIVLTCLALILLVTPAMAATPTTQVHIVKYANDGTTILNETTKTYQWMEANLPVLGDGTTHYYHQGPLYGVYNSDPVIQEQLRWNPEEDTNVLEKDMGAVKGTNLKDLCDLVGGMSPDEEVIIKASDGLTKNFNYTNVYEYQPRQGPMGICWYTDFDFNPATPGVYPDTGYSEGMRLIFFADDSVNTLGPGGSGVHAFGNFDWHETADSKYWYYKYEGATDKFPTTTGLSVQAVSDIIIYSNDPVPVLTSITVTPATPTVDIGDTQQFTASGRDQSNNPYPVTVTWTSSNTAVGYYHLPGGLFTALTSGTTTITATDGLVSGPAAVTVPRHPRWTCFSTVR